MNPSFLIGVLRRLAALACVAALSAPSLFAQVRGLSYTVSPVAERLYFDGNAAMDDATLYGGQLGLGFGRFVELEGVYLLSDGASNDFSEVGGIADATREKLEALEGRDIALRRYGGRIKFNAPSANVLPFVTLGGGVLSFEPDDLNETRTIYLSLGGGLQFSVAGRYAVSFGAERFAYRYNLGATFFDDLDLARADLSDQSFNHVQVANWALRAGLHVYVGGRAPGEETALDEALRQQFSGGLRGLSLRLEPFAGQINFNQELGFKTEQRMAGVYAGLNLGPFIGARGFYWRGVESGLFEFDRLQAYGGELRFELTTGQSLSPYLIVGGGYLDVLSGYAGRRPDGDGFASPSTPEDEPFIIAGGGAVLPLNESLSLNAGARSLLLTREGVDNVNGPSDVVSSWMFSAGLSFGFGASDGGAGEAIRSEIAGAGAARDREEAEMRRELAEAEARIDSLARLIQRIGEGDVEAIREAQVTAPTSPRDTLVERRVARREDRMVTLPLPEQGELYIRFGDPGGVSIESVVGDDRRSVDVADLPAERQTFAAERQTLTAEQIEQIVSQTVREQLRASEAAAPSEADLDRIERQIQNRLDALEDRLQVRLDRRLADIETSIRPPRVIVEDEEGIMREVRVATGVRRRTARAFYPFTAFMSGRPNLWIVGLRFDPGAPFLGPVELQPEISVGIGAETYAYHVNLDAVYTAGFVERVVSGLRPYVGIGAGMLGFDERPEDAPGVQLTFNMRIGSEFALRWGRFFLEYGTYDLFEYDRFAAGYRLGF